MDWIRSFNPVNVTEAVRQLILCLSLFGVLTWSTEQQAGFLMAISAVFALFVRSNTISAVKLDQRVDERVAAVDAGVRGTKGSDGPDVPGTGSGYNKLSAFLLVAVAATTLACASSQKQKVVVAYQSAESALGQFQDAEIALYNMKTVASLTEEKHKAIHAALAKAFDAQIKVGSGLLIWETGKPAPASVQQWLTEAERVLAELRTQIPDNDRLKLVQALIPWIRAILDTVRLLGVQPPPALEAVAEQGGI